jgi:hypothetical protein
MGCGTMHFACVYRAIGSKAMTYEAGETEGTSITRLEKRDKTGEASITSLKT